MTQTLSHPPSGLLCRWAWAQVLLRAGDKSPLAPSTASGATFQEEEMLGSLVAMCAVFSGGGQAAP